MCFEDLGQILSFQGSQGVVAAGHIDHGDVNAAGRSRAVSLQCEPL